MAKRLGATGKTSRRKVWVVEHGTSENGFGSCLPFANGTEPLFSRHVVILGWGNHKKHTVTGDEGPRMGTYLGSLPSFPPSPYHMGASKNGGHAVGFSESNREPSILGGIRPFQFYPSLTLWLWPVRTCLTSWVSWSEQVTKLVVYH